MSQNPNDGPNYNPYGQNPANPNYPPPTAYGSAPPPPSGPNPGYSPNPPSGPNANTPPSSYGAYGTPNPYAPPPPPGVDTGANPYDPYAPTMMSQNPISAPGYPGTNPPSSPGYPGMASSPGYPAYAPQMGQVTQPPPPVSAPPTRNRGPVVLISIIALIVVLGGGAFGAIAYNNNQQSQHASATATAGTATAIANATVGAKATATAIANTYPFSNKVLLNDPMVDNSKGVRWDDNQSSGCFFAGSAYHVVQAKSGFYNTCSALGMNYSNFTFEAEMVIKSGGDGAAGGLTFRGDENNNKYYRLSIDTSGNYFILVSVDSTGTTGNARKLKDGVASSFSSGAGATNTLAVVARGDTYAFYVNQQLVTSFTDSTYTSGQIGFDVDFGTSSTELLFTNVKVWQL